MEKLIGVIAGTPVDTEMGLKFLEKKRMKSIGYSVSKNAKEQSRLQLLSKEILYEKVTDIINKSKNNGVNVIFLYCNSLSAAVDIEKLSIETNIPIITPFTAYKDYGEKYSSLLVLVANGQSCSKIETILEESNKSIRIWSISSLPLVEEIETGKSANMIIENLNLELILGWAKFNGVDGIILGCTHFPYIKESLEKKTDIPILDPGEKMLENLIELCKK